MAVGYIISLRSAAWDHKWSLGQGRSERGARTGYAILGVENMRICVDASPLLLRSVGVKTYFYHWLQHLTVAAEPDEIVAFPWIGKLGPLDHQRSQLGLFGTCLRRGFLAAANRKIPFALQALMPKADLFHVSNQLRNPPQRIPITATIHDFTTLLVPHLHTESNLRTDKYFGEVVLKRAKRLIADSHNTRSDAVRLLGLNPDLIEVIYPGVSERYFEQTTQRPSSFDKPYVLFVGTIEPRKNVALLLDAYSQLADSVREAFDLIIVGPTGWKAEDTMARLLSPPPGVRYLRYVAEADLPAIVAGATVMAYPSLYEGFGLPVAEAMACGVPVITSAVSSLPEVAEDSALFVDPRSVSELRSALDTLLSRPDLRRQLGQCGTARARAHYRWSACAQRSMEFFRKVISN